MRYFFLFLSLFLTVFIRVLFLAEFPFAFGHADTSQYLTSVINMIQGAPFIPEVIRPNGTYSLFCYFVFKTFGLNSFHVIFLQSIFGVFNGLICFWLSWKLTRFWYLSIAVLLLVSLRPRGMVYEHILLAESLYEFLSICCCGLLLLFWSSPKMKNVLALSLCCVLLYFLRGQGVVFILASLCFIFALWAKLRQEQKPKLKVFGILIVFSLPLVFSNLYYRDLNKRTNHFSGISISGNYNLFWVASSNFMDFESSTFKDLKDALRPCVLESNQKFYQNLAWALQGGPCSQAFTFVVREFFPKKYGTDWDQINAEMGAVALESILTHPIAFGYRFFWNLRDFFLYRRSLWDTTDLNGYFFEKSEKKLRIKFEQLAYLRELDSIHGLKLEQASSLQTAFSVLLVQRDQPKKMEKFFNSTKKMVFCPLVFFAITFSFFLLICHPYPFRWGIGVFYLIWVLHPAMTVLAVNAVYDRYYLLPEALGFVLIAVGVSQFIRLSLSLKFQTVLVFCSIVILVKLFWIGVSRFVYPFVPIFDKPILGLPEWVVTSHQVDGISFYLSCIVALILIGLAVQLFAKQRAKSSLSFGDAFPHKY